MIHQSPSTLGEIGSAAGKTPCLEAVRRQHRDVRQQQLAQRFDRIFLRKRITASAGKHGINHERH